MCVELGDALQPVAHPTDENKYSIWFQHYIPHLLPTIAWQDMPDQPYKTSLNERLGSYLRVQIEVSYADE